MLFRIICTHLLGNTVLFVLKPELMSTSVTLVGSSVSHISNPVYKMVGMSFSV